MMVEPGAKFECRLHIPTLDWPLRIEEATVRWVNGNSFGIAFSRITPEELAKLEAVLSELDQGE